MKPPRKPKAQPPDDSQKDSPPPVIAPTETPEEKEERERIERAMRALTPDERTRAADRYAAWRDPSSAEKVCTAAQEKWLLAIGMIKDPTKSSGKNYPPLCGANDLGKILREHFAGKLNNDFSYQSFKGWRSNPFLANHPGCPAFPRAGRDRYSPQACIEWVQKWIVDDDQTGRVAGASAGTATERIKLAEAIIKEIEAEKAHREASGLYILTATSARTGAGLGIVARNAARDILEKQLPVKIAAGLDAIIPDDAMRQALLEKVRRDGLDLLGDFQNSYKQRATEIIKQGTVAVEV